MEVEKELLRNLTNSLEYHDKKKASALDSQIIQTYVIPNGVSFYGEENLPYSYKKQFDYNGRSFTAFFLPNSFNNWSDINRDRNYQFANMIRYYWLSSKLILNFPKYMGVNDLNSPTYFVIENVKTSKLNNGKIKVECKCGFIFYTNFPIQTNPLCDNCPNCREIHRDPRYNIKTLQHVESPLSLTNLINRFPLSISNTKTEIDCECGCSFSTNFPMQTNPSCDNCPKCHKIHYDTNYNDYIRSN